MLHGNEYFYVARYLSIYLYSTVIVYIYVER